MDQRAEYLEAHAVWHETAGYDRDRWLNCFAATARRWPPEPLRARQQLPPRGEKFPDGIPAHPAGRCAGRSMARMALYAGYGHSNISACIAPNSISVISATCCCWRSVPISAFNSEPDGDPLRAFRSVGTLSRCRRRRWVLPSHALPLNGIQPRGVPRQHHSERPGKVAALCRTSRALRLKCPPQLVRPRAGMRIRPSSPSAKPSRIRIICGVPANCNCDSDAAGIHRFVRML